MVKNNIDLAALTTHGKAEIRHTGGAADVWTTNSITPTSFNLYGDSFKRHYVSLPGRYRLPLRVDMTIMLDFPALLLFIGNGHITFATGRQDNRRIEDLVKPSGKPNQDHHSYDNSLPSGELVDISVTYDFGEMQILIGGEERFYSRRQAYMRAKDLHEQNEDGFALGLAVSKLSTLSIKNITVTEFDGDAPVTRGSFEENKPKPTATVQPKPTLESIAAGLPSEFRDELIQSDNFLTALRPLKFKRTIDKSGAKITYVASDFGVSYAINMHAAGLLHDFGWYIVTNGKSETWHRRADYMEESLAEIAKSDPQLAERIFYALNDCVGCYGARCLAKTLYEFNGNGRLACHGRVLLRMCHSDFHDAREFFRHLNVLAEHKAASGELPTVKHILQKEQTT